MNRYRIPVKTMTTAIAATAKKISRRAGVAPSTFSSTLQSSASAGGYCNCNSYSLVRQFGSTQAPGFPMKAGTELKDLAIFKGQDAPITLERSEYPEWVNELLAKPQPSLATLRKIPNEEADLDQIKRYLKLTRRQAVRQRNEESAA